MEYKDLVKDFIDRTNHNLSIIEKKVHQEEKSYEVTQLINSLLGLLIFPQQKFFDRIPKDSIKKAKEDGWIIPNPIVGEQVENLSNYLRYLRNGVSHCNIKFISNNNREITTIKVWNKNHQAIKDWEIELSIEEIKSITIKLTELIKKF